ncbi:DUF6011 domain-containing protein [Streptomyces sp. NPDC056738]|uniref:DUF6011 domain-containing protein n=1 Tax=Streptomyces sp. NPDC056738 TaxID=3345933 RepID=UPI0036AC6164
MTGRGGATGEAASCMACGRLLRDQESRRLRLGPTCRKRLQAALAPRPRRVVGTHTAGPHPLAIPAHRTTQLEIWDDEDDEDEDDLYRPRAVTDVPTGVLL